MSDGMEKAQIEELSVERVFKADGVQYVVPLYQREYAWGRPEIERLLNDLFLAFVKGDGANYYLGSFVVRKEKGSCGRFELVDGQQRLITLSLLFALHLNDDGQDKVLHFQLRDDADRWIDACYQKQKPDQETDSGSFATAIATIRDFYPETKEGERKFDGASGSAIEQVLSLTAGGMTFKEYLLKKVVLFRIELPGSTDVNSYFEIMNNRGEQLQYHEIMKAGLLAKLSTRCHDDPKLGSYDDLAPMFDDIWTACSRMDGHVGMHLHMCAKYLARPECGWTDVLEWKKYQAPLSKDGDKTGTATERSVIWEFSNFLMHALKCYQKKYIPGSKVVVTLDERDMQVKYEALEKDIDPVLFLDLLIRLRLKFDKYVVKAENDANGDVEAWHLSYVEKYKKSYDTVNTFAGDIQSRLQQFESMLQVSFNTQRNKDWLQYLLELDDSMFDENAGAKLLEALKSWAGERISTFRAEKENEDKDFYCLGLETSRFMLNLVDYLMWEANGREDGDPDFTVPKEFVFKYLNSVEHHHPQHDDQTIEPWKAKEIDDIGNLFLVYSSENSSMNNREPREKRNRYQNAHGGDLPENPKRRWMYEHTENDWTVADMKRLSSYIRKLMGEFIGSYGSGN